MGKTTFTLKRKQFGFVGNMFGMNNFRNLKALPGTTAMNLKTHQPIKTNAAGKELTGWYKAGQIGLGSAKFLGSSALVAGGLAAGTGMLAKKGIEKAGEQSDGSKMFSQNNKNDMATTYRLKRKVFSLGLNGEVLTPAQKLAEMKKITGQKNLKDMQLRTSDAVTFNKNAKAKIDTAKAEVAKKNRAYAEFRGNTAGMKGFNKAQGGAAQQIYERGKAVGTNSATLGQGLKNSWGRMGTLGKVGVIGGGIAATSLMAKGLFGNKNKEQQG